MSGTSLLNLVGLLVALAVGWGAIICAPSTPAQAAPAAAPLVERVFPELCDVRGTRIPRQDYRRIVSLGMQSDALLCELCEPERIVGASIWSVGPWTHRLGRLPRLRGLEDLESILALKPDVVLVSSGGSDSDRLARLRAAGLTVCDLGPQGGVEALLANAQLIGRLIGAPQRAERFMASFTRRLAAVQAIIPAGTPRRSAVYVQCLGDQLFGGTTGTTFHHVLVSAGVNDRAAQIYSGWPHYTIEQLVSLDPDLLVTPRGGAARLRRLPGISAMRAARDATGIIELDPELLQCSGPVLLDAAEALCAAVYQRPGP